MKLPPEQAAEMPALLGQAVQAAAGVRARPEEREEDVFLITAVGSPGLKDADPGQPRPSWSEAKDLRTGEVYLKMKGVTTENMVELLETFVEAPIINETGIQGRFDVASSAGIRIRTPIGPVRFDYGWSLVEKRSEYFISIANPF